MRSLARARRFGCAFVALSLAGLTLRAQLASALVTRGDDAMRAADAGAAVRAYGRALAVDPASAIAADRLAFFLAVRHDRRDTLRALDVTARALAVAPDPALFADRAFAEMALHRWRAAAGDFGAAGALARDARYDHLAARMAMRAGDRARARSFARRALAEDPSFAPARALLRSVE